MIFPATSVLFALGVSCTPLVVGTPDVNRCAATSLEYTGTPLNVVMMLAGVWFLLRSAC